MQVTLGLASAGINHGRVQSELSYLKSPAVATGFTYTLSTAYAEWPICLSFQLATDANAANRQIGLSLLTPSGVALASVPVGSVQAASLTYTYTFASWITSANAVQALKVISPFFPFVVPDDYSFAVTITNHEAGDQISNIAYYRDRYSTGPDGYPMGGYDLAELEARAVETLNQG